MDDGMFTDYQKFTGSNRAVEVAIDAKSAGEFQLAGHVCSFV
jgi:hypothetical protein